MQSFYPVLLMVASQESKVDLADYFTLVGSLCASWVGRHGIPGGWKRRVGVTACMPHFWSCLSSSKAQKT